MQRLGLISFALNVNVLDNCQKKSSTSFVKKNCEQKTELYLIRIFINTTTTRQLCASSREHPCSVGQTHGTELTSNRTEIKWERRRRRPCLWAVSRKIKWDLNREKEIESDSHLNTKAIYNIFIFYVPLSIRYGLNYQKKRLNGANKLHFLDHHFHPPGFFLLVLSPSRHKMTSLRLSLFFYSSSLKLGMKIRAHSELSSLQFSLSSVNTRKRKKMAKNLVGFSPTMDISKALL